MSIGSGLIHVRNSRRQLFTCERLETRSLFAIPGTSLGIWHTYAQATADLQTIHNAYPDLTELVSIGTTVQNRDIWAMKITDNPTAAESEPEFYYQGSMHGNEPIGMEMSFYFIQELLTEYGSSSSVTNLVNETEIWVVPNLNWDGYSRPGGAWRENANGVDLNRSFPEWTTGNANSPDTVQFGPYGNLFDGPAINPSGLQKETVAIMNFRASRRFVSSMSLHSGSLVVNYPWDTNANGVPDYAPAPDDELLEEMALQYADNNWMMRNYSAFPNGITNGDDWYEVSGGMQDWSNIYTGCLDLTAELSNNKYPSASQLPTLWSANDEAMFEYIETAHWGVSGDVTDALSGAPLSAKIRVLAPAPSPAPDPSHPAYLSFFTDPALGDFHRPLLDGTYSLEFSSPGYVTQVVTGIHVDDKTSAPLKIALMPVDNEPPAVTASEFQIDTPCQQFSITFGEDVTNIQPSDLVLQNLTTGQFVPTGWIACDYAPGTHTIEFTFPGYPSGILPNGNYRATLPAGAVKDAAGNPTLTAYSCEFFVLAGDANRSRTVDITDLAILATNWQCTDRTFSTGDFDYSGTVDISDLAILATNWQQSMPLPPQALSASRLVRRPVVRPVTDIFLA